MAVARGKAAGRIARLNALERRLQVFRLEIDVMKPEDLYHIRNLMQEIVWMCLTREGR